MDNGSAFCKKTKGTPKGKNLTQTEVGEYLGYGYTAITNYESGRNRPSYEDLIKLCVLFHVSADYLIGYSDTREQQEIEKKAKRLFCPVKFRVKPFSKGLRSAGRRPAVYHLLVYRRPNKGYNGGKPFGRIPYTWKRKMK